MKTTIIMIVGFALASGIATGADVKQNYEQHCVKCHGEDGKGNTKMGKKTGVKDYTDAKVQQELKDEVAFKSIKEGKKDGDKVIKKAIEGLSDDEIKALVKHIRTFGPKK